MLYKKMGAEQADGLINPENKPNLTEIISSADEQTLKELDKKQIQNLSQYYYERKEISTSTQKIENKNDTKEEPDSTTIIGNRVIQVGKPKTIYEKRVVSKTIKREGNINNNSNITKTTQTKIIKTIEKENSNENNDEINNDINNNISNEMNNNKINNINNSIQKKNIISYNNPSIKIMHKNIIQNKNIKQKNILPKTNLNVNKTTNYFIPSNNNIINNTNNNNKKNIQLNTNKSFENFHISSNTPNNLLSSANNIISTRIQLKKVEMPNNFDSQRSHSPDLNSIKRKTINRGEQIKNIQITHIICSNKNKNPDFHITEKLSTNNIKTTPLTISIQDREKLKHKGKSTYTSSCTEPKIIPTQNLKGKTTIYQHARGIGMTNDRRNSNSNYYTSDIKKLEYIEPIVMKKEKVEHIENFRSSKFRNNNNTIDICSRNKGNKKIIGNKNEKEKIFVIKDENDENKNGNIIA